MSDIDKISMSGCLEILDGHMGPMGMIRDSSGMLHACRFRPEHGVRLPAAWMHHVEVTGKRVLRDHEYVLEVLDFKVGQSQADFLEVSKSTSFWGEKSLEDLQKEQQVEAVASTDDLIAISPFQDDGEELLDFILAERHERRKLG